MKALIFNSGLGSRLGELTRRNPKCLVRLGSGETIFHRQLRILFACGVRDFVVTTGPWPEQVEAVAAEFEAQGCTFAFVRNGFYDQTNYLYSMWLARERLRGEELLLLHGDLVFDAAYVEGLLSLPTGSYGSVDPTLPLPEKDFKARVIGGEVREVGVQTWGDDCCAFQAMYRLAPEAVDTWLDEVDAFVARGETGVYAENAANLVFDRMHVAAHAYTGHVLEEIDTPEDLARVSAMARAIDFASQPAFVLDGGGARLAEGSAAGRVLRTPTLGDVIGACGLRRPLVVSDRFFSAEALRDILGAVAPATASKSDDTCSRQAREEAHGALGVTTQRDNADKTQTHATLASARGSNEYSGGLSSVEADDMPWPVFSGYEPNPTYEQVLAAIRRFRANGCDSVVSVGGGSAIDVAKCVKLWAGLPGDGSGSNDDNPRYCDIDTGFSAIRHVSIPTTAGTGSESTHFAVVYVDGQKRSVAADCLQPDVALLVPGLLAGLPDYQRKATMLDALCQAIESHWSVASGSQSRAYSSRAIPMVMASWEAYLQGDADAARTMHEAANLAGRAINLTTTTLAHAMSYKLTSLYGLAHGHAVALCLPFAWRMLLQRGDAKTKERLAEIDALVTGDASSDCGAGFEMYQRMCQGVGLKGVKDVCEADITVLVKSINLQRMANYPLALSDGVLSEAYRQILGL